MPCTPSQLVTPRLVGLPRHRGTPRLHRSLSLKRCQLFDERLETGVCRNTMISLKRSSYPHRPPSPAGIRCTEPMEAAKHGHVGWRFSPLAELSVEQGAGMAEGLMPVKMVEPVRLARPSSMEVGEGGRRLTRWARLRWARLRWAVRLTWALRLTWDARLTWAAPIECVEKLEWVVRLAWAARPGGSARLVRVVPLG